MLWPTHIQSFAQHILAQAILTKMIGKIVLWPNQIFGVSSRCRANRRRAQAIGVKMSPESGQSREICVQAINPNAFDACSLRTQLTAATETAPRPEPRLLGAKHTAVGVRLQAEQALFGGDKFYSAAAWRGGSSAPES